MSKKLGGFGPRQNNDDREKPGHSALVVGDNYDFWLSEGDSIYDEIYEDDSPPG